MRRPILITDRFVRYALLAALIVNAGIWLYTYRRLASVDAFMPLHYTIYFGVDLFGPRIYAYAYPAFGTLALLVNLVIAARAAKRLPMLSRIVAGATPLIMLLLAIGVTAVSRYYR